MENTGDDLKALELLAETHKLLGDTKGYIATMMVLAAEHLRLGNTDAYCETVWALVIDENCTIEEV